GFAVPISMRRYNDIESSDTISPTPPSRAFIRSASSTPTSLLPQAVGPARNQQRRSRSGSNRMVQRFIVSGSRLLAASVARSRRERESALGESRLHCGFAALFLRTSFVNPQLTGDN